MVEETKNETSKTHRSKIILSQSNVFGPRPKLFGQGSKKAKFIVVKYIVLLAKPKIIRTNSKYFGPYSTTWKKTYDCLETYGGVWRP